MARPRKGWDKLAAATRRRYVRYAGSETEARRRYESGETIDPDHPVASWARGRADTPAPTPTLEQHPSKTMDTDGAFLYFEGLHL